MKRFLLLTIALTGCATSFRDTSTVTFKPVPNLATTAFEVADAVAKKHGLSADETATSATKRGYFGSPYHYYTVEVMENEGTLKCVVFTHEGRLANPKKPRHGPDEDFVDALKAALGDQVVGVKMSSNPPTP